MLKPILAGCATASLLGLATVVQAWGTPIVGQQSAQTPSAPNTPTTQHSTTIRVINNSESDLATSNRDHIDQDAQVSDRLTTQPPGPSSPTNGVGGTGGGRITNLPPTPTNGTGGQGGGRMTTTGDRLVQTTNSYGGQGGGRYTFRPTYIVGGIVLAVGVYAITDRPKSN